jgi:Asp-tRNA(Asn)/Glu-tRNA(Gln) amidotransferase A subunit family amidase
MDYHHMSALQLASAVRERTLTATEVVTATLMRIAKLDARINAFTHVSRDRALLQAAEIDRALQQGAKLPPLAGVPFAAKNLFDIAGVTTIAGSKTLACNPVAERDAVLVERLTRAGAICIGALNMDEFAYGFTTENSHAGPCRNPHDTSRIAGGSSGGSAAAVAAGMVPLSLGSDTNGSIRVPSSLCRTPAASHSSRVSITSARLPAAPKTWRWRMTCARARMPPIPPAHSTRRKRHGRNWPRA